MPRFKRCYFLQNRPPSILTKDEKILIKFLLKLKTSSLFKLTFVLAIKCMSLFQNTMRGLCKKKYFQGESRVIHLGLRNFVKYFQVLLKEFKGKNSNFCLTQDKFKSKAVIFERLLAVCRKWKNKNFISSFLCQE